MRTVRLDKTRAYRLKAVVDILKHNRLFGDRLLNDGQAPLVININGVYIKVSMIRDLLVNYSDNELFDFNNLPLADIKYIWR